MTGWTAREERLADALRTVEALLCAAVIDGDGLSMLPEDPSMHEDANRAMRLLHLSYDHARDSLKREEGGHPTVPFQVAMFEYQQLRAASDALAEDAPNADEAVEAYCKAMDAVIEMPADSATELAIKIELIEDRLGTDAGNPDYFAATKRDIAALASRERVA